MSHDLAPWRNSSVASAGISVSAISSAPIKAKQTVKAIGVNRRCRMCSTITSEPSTIMPKSMAPSESRFAGIPARYMQTNANSGDKGIVGAVRNAAFALPRKNSKTSVTTTRPSASVKDTVRKVLSTSSVRS